MKANDERNTLQLFVCIVCPTDGAKELPSWQRILKMHKKGTLFHLGVSERKTISEDIP